MGTNDIPLGHYVLTRRIGLGGMGEVYLAEDRTTGRPAAVKVIRPGAWLNRFVFEREVAALATLRHPGIVRVLDSGIEDGTPWYAMELVQGRTLADCLLHLAPTTFAAAQSTAMTCDLNLSQDTAASESGSDTADPPSSHARMRMLGWLVDVARALAYIHGEGLVHGDLKPGNVMITRADRAMLIDFGLAGVVGSRADPTSIATAGLRMGTAGFLAPERIRGEGLDARADLYALGCLIYLAVTGRGPAGHGTPERQLNAHLSRTPAKPGLLAPDVPPALDDLVMALLAKNPMDRPAHAGLVATALERLGARGSIDTTTTPEPRPYLYHPSFVGREAPLAALEAQWAHAVAGSGGVTWIQGSPGSGKTRIMSEFLRRVRSPDMIVCAAHAEAAPLGAGGPTGSAPLVLWDRVLLQLGDPSGCAALARSTDGAQEAQVRLVRAIAQTLRLASVDKPVLVVLDDIQWADELSLAILEGLASALRDIPAHIVAAGVDEASDVVGATVVEIGPLNDVELSQVLSESLGSQQVPATAERVVLAHAKGSPFLAVEWLQLLLRGNVLRRGNDGDWTLGSEPATAQVMAVVSSRAPEQRVALRLAALTGAARDLAGAAAVLGRTFDPDLLAQLSEQSASEVSPALRELLRADLIREAEHDLLAWCDVDLMRAAYSALDPDTRHRHHSVLLTLSASLSHMERAYHMSRAGRVEESRTLYLAAARASRERWAMDHASACYEAALALGEEDEVWLDACIEFLRHALLPRDHPQTVRRATHALRVARSRNHDVAVGHCHSLLAECALMAGSLEEARREDTLALRYHARAGDTPEEVRCLIRLARVQQLSGRLDDAEGLAREAACLSVGVAETEGQVLAALASIMSDMGRLDDAVEIYNLGLKSLRAHGSRRHQCSVQQNIGAALATQGNPAGALEAYAAALEIAVDIGDVRQRALIRCNIGVAHANLGNHEMALEHNRHAQALYRTVGQAAGVANTQRVNGQVLVEMGRPAEALDELAEVFGFFWDSGQTTWCGDVLAYIAWAHLMMGDTASALRLLDGVDQLTGESEVAVVRSLALRLRARALIAAMRHREASEVLDRAELVAAQMGATDAAEDIQELRERIEESHEPLRALG